MPLTAARSQPAARRSSLHHLQRMSGEPGVGRLLARLAAEGEPVSQGLDDSRASAAMQAGR
jgi:hypothetical protein